MRHFLYNYASKPHLTNTGKVENYKTAETRDTWLPGGQFDNWDPWFVPLALLYRLCQADSRCLLLHSKSVRWWRWRWRGRRPSGDWWRAGRVRTVAGGSVLLQAPWPQDPHTAPWLRDSRGHSEPQHAATQPPARHPPLLRPRPRAGRGPGHGEWVGPGPGRGHHWHQAAAGKVWVTQSCSGTTAGGQGLVLIGGGPGAGLPHPIHTLTRTLITNIESSHLTRSWWWCHNSGYLGSMPHTNNSPTNWVWCCPSVESRRNLVTVLWPCHGGTRTSAWQHDSWLLSNTLEAVTCCLGISWSQSQTEDPIIPMLVDAKLFTHISPPTLLSHLGAYHLIMLNTYHLGKQTPTNINYPSVISPFNGD